MPKLQVNQRILAIVVTYYPERELLEKNISAFIEDVDKVLIWENTPTREKMSYRFIEHEKVEYCGDGINSISHGLNFAWRYARNQGFDYLLTMDQDSEFQNFSVLKEYANQHPNSTMLLGPWYNANRTPSQQTIKVEALITSGMLVKIEILNTLEGYNETLAVDGVDTDLCLRANLLGIYSYQLTYCFMQQRFGLSQVKIHRGKEYHFHVYPPKRLKSIVKSHIYLMRKYPNMSIEMRNNIKNWYIIDRLQNIVLFEDKKIPKFFSIIIGMIEGRLQKL